MPSRSAQPETSGLRVTDCLSYPRVPGPCTNACEWEARDACVYLCSTHRIAADAGCVCMHAARICLAHVQVASEVCMSVQVRTVERDPDPMDSADDN